MCNVSFDNTLGPVAPFTNSEHIGNWLSDDHPAPRLGPPPPGPITIPAQEQLQATPLPPAPDFTSEALLNARKRARSLLSAAGGAGDLTSASSGSTMAKPTLGA